MPQENERKVLKYTLACEEDVIDLDNNMRIYYAERKGYTLDDVWVSYPSPKSGPVWFVWKKDETSK